MIKIYTQVKLGRNWLAQYQGKKPIFACLLGFTATGLIPGISAAGATPQDREYTAIADAEFLLNGYQLQPQYPLPPLTVGASPVLISRAVVTSLKIPVYLLNTGLPRSPAVSSIDLGGMAANCLTTGKALPFNTVKHLFVQGLNWGEKLGQIANHSYVIIGECVVGGTTTALAILTALGIQAIGKVNSSHACCNHEQKWQIVQSGLAKANLDVSSDPLTIVAAVGDPMQVVAAGMAIAASRYAGVILAGGTQMLAVFALLRRIAADYHLDWQPQRIIVGTTRWVVEDATGDTVGLTKMIADVPLLATQLSFSDSRYPNLKVYEQGYVKEGVGAGGCAIAASLYQNWTQQQLLEAIEALAATL